MHVVFPFQALHIFSNLVPLFEASDFIGPLYVILAFLGPGSIVSINCSFIACIHNRSRVALLQLQGVSLSCQL